jgi:hypothetical protein
METYDRPLSDARYAPIEKTKFTRGARCANFLYGPRKSEFGDSLVKVLFLERTVPEKKTDQTFGWSVSIFFKSSPIGK